MREYLLTKLKVMAKTCCQHKADGFQIRQLGSCIISNSLIYILKVFVKKSVLPRAPMSKQENLNDLEQTLCAD